MNYPICIHFDKGSAYGVTVPDISGCFSAGDTLDEAFINAVEAIESHLAILAEDGVLPPIASKLEDLHNQEEYGDAFSWGIVPVDITAFMGKTEKVNATLPTLLTRQIDNLVHSGKAKNRSAFLAEAAAEKIAHFAV